MITDFIMELLEAITQSSRIQLIYLIIGYTCFLIYRIMLSISVYISCKERCAKGKTVWSVFTFIFGLIVAIICKIATHKKEKKSSLSAKKTFIILTVILILLSSNMFFIFNLSQTGEFEYFLNYPIAFDEVGKISYSDKYGRNVIYDKMGNTYTFIHRGELLYYDKEGTTYTAYDGEDEGFTNTETNEKYSEFEYDFFVSDEGYLYIFEEGKSNLKYHEDSYHKLHNEDSDDDSYYWDDIYVYYDDNHIYFEPCDVSWDESGNIICFDEETDKLLSDKLINKN